MRLKEKVAIVTGAARGLGREFCLALAREGASVVAADIVSCADTIREVRQSGWEAVEERVEVSDSEGTRALASSTVDRFGRIDILVNNAAVLPTFTPFEQIREDDWDHVMAVNVKGMW
ncbi:MAG: SDR family NAD(P)-dependent oxidoreductase, partial [Acidobacteriota bacterium]|nr:SDR family NAD(P)-dependent oxidoreductase [Acidobacteriota bacterium]